MMLGWVVDRARKVECKEIGKVPGRLLSDHCSVCYVLYACALKGSGKMWRKRRKIVNRDALK